MYTKWKGNAKEEGEKESSHGERERVGNERERVIAHNNAGMHALLYFAKIIAKKSIPSRATRTTTFEAIHAFVSLSAPSSSSVSGKKRQRNERT